MITYVRNNIEGFYAEFPQEIDTAYWQGKIGTTYEDFVDGKWVRLSEQQAQFHIDNPDASVREVIAMQLDPRTIEQAKDDKLEAIEEYDNSDAVNVFYVLKDGGNVPTWENMTESEQIDFVRKYVKTMLPSQWYELSLEEKNAYIRNVYIEEHKIPDWFTAAERSNHKDSIDAAETLGIETLDVPIAGQSITIPVQSAKLMLAQIQLYADACYRVTETHKATVNAIETIEEVDAYDYTIGYPEKLTFTI